MAEEQRRAARPGVRRSLAVAGGVVALAVAALVVIASRGDEDRARVQATASSSSTSAAPSTASLSRSQGAEPTSTTTTTSGLVAAPPAGRGGEGDPAGTDAPPLDEPRTAPPPTEEAGPAYGADALVYKDWSTHTLWAINPDGSARTSLGDAQEMWLVGLAPGHQQMAWTEAGLSEQGRRIHVRNLDGSDDRTLDPRDASGNVLAPFYDARFSPDGSTIAYTCLRPENWNHPHVCTVDVATGAARDLIADYGLAGVNRFGDPLSYSLGDWSPDGRSLSYVELASDPENDSAFLFVVEVETGAATNLGTTGPFGFSGMFTADGSAVLSAEGGSALYVVPVDGSARTQVPGIAVGGIDRSPDGEWFLAAGNDTAVTYFNLAGETRIVPGTEHVSASAW
jgi:hypothetical protein